MDTLNLETLLANLMALTIGCGVLFIYTAKWRRARAMRKLAYELDCNYKPTDSSLLDVYDKFFTLQAGHAPRIMNVLTRQDEAVSVCIFDLTYVKYDRFKNMHKGHLRHRTIVALTRPKMTLPHFYVRPETTSDKVRETFQGAIDGFEQFKEGINAMTGGRIKNLDEHVNRSSDADDWLNRDEIELLHDRQFSDAHWIKGRDREATQNFLSGPVTQSIEAEPGLVWEGFETMLLLSEAKGQISHKEIGRYLDVARGFISTALASSKSNSEEE